MFYAFNVHYHPDPNDQYGPSGEIEANSIEEVIEYIETNFPDEAGFCLNGYSIDPLDENTTEKYYCVDGEYEW